MSPSNLDSKCMTTLQARAALQGFEIDLWLQLRNREAVLWFRNLEDLANALTALEAYPAEAK